MALPQTPQSSRAHPGHQRSDKASRGGGWKGQCPAPSHSRYQGTHPALCPPPLGVPGAAAHCPGRAQPFPAPQCGAPASSPAPAENICCSQLAAKCHGLASAQPELVLYKPLIALKHEVLIPSTLPLLYKGYSSAPSGSVPFPSKLKLAADSKLCCTASRVPMLSPSTSGAEQQAAQCNWKEGAHGCHREGSLLRASQGSFPLCSSINSVPNKPLQAPCGIREIPTQLQTSPKLLSQWESTTEVQAT